MVKAQDIRQIISELVKHMKRQNIHDLIDTLDDNSLRELLKKIFEYACGIERMK